MNITSENLEGFRAVLWIVGIAFVLSLTIPFAQAQNKTASLFATDSKPYGLTYSQWAGKWWKWFDEIPKSASPATDKTGANCAVGQSGPVWFLSGTTGGSAERTCTVPAGKAILFAPLNSECSYAEFPSLKTESDLLSCAKHFQDEVTSLQASVDGVTLQGLGAYRVQTPLFNETFPVDNIAGAPPGPTQGVGDGNWVFIKPLPPGKHEIYLSGASTDITATAVNNFANEARYHIIVK
jgi:hypothetical protein